MDWLDYREKLGIGFCDKERTGLFFTKMFNALARMEHSISAFYRENEHYAFCNMTGIRVSSNVPYGGEFDDVLSILNDNCHSVESFLSYYIAFVTCYSKSVYVQITKEELFDLVKQMLEEARIPFDVVKDEDGHFIFPKGAKELDDALISEPLIWLQDYPQAYKTFATALRQYSEGIYVRDVADNLRKALEAFLQEFLGNTKNLETNKNEICKYLGEQGVDAGISGLFQPLINAYKSINDRIAKHNDAVDKKLLEFLLYQTGVLIRMVIVVKVEGGPHEA